MARGLHSVSIYTPIVCVSKTCVKRPLTKRPKISFQDQFSLNAGQKYCRMLQGEHSAILSTFIKLPFVIKIFVLSIFECAFYTGFTVHAYCSDAFSLINVACKQAVLMIQIVPCYKCPPQIFYFVFTFTRTGPRSAVGNVSGYRCVSDCRSRGREFDPGPVPYFRGD